MYFSFSRILGFYRVPPTAGREVNLTQDIRRLSEPKLKKTFFISPGTKIVLTLRKNYISFTSYSSVFLLLI